MPKFLIIFLSAVLTLNAQVSSFLFAGDVSTANKADHTTVGQTYSTYNGTSTTEFDSVIPSSELNGISNSDYFENYNHQDVDRYNSHGNESNNLNTTIMSRDDETIYQFTNCGQTGRTGPSQSQTDNAYAGTSLDGAVTVSGGIQSWTVPTTGDYTIDSYGAQGGGPNGGLGAWMSGTFPLTAGQTIKVLVGQMGSYSAPMTTGGGGSFVATSTNAPMIVAGGGGAASQVGSGNQNGNTTITGGVAYGGWPDVGLQTYNAGTSGNGGDGSSGSGGGGGGGGFSTNGNDDDAFGYSFLNGGVGGSGGLSGGFGGGGGARNNGNNYWGGGAGGGYSGGAGACGTTTYDEVAGGGGSYNSGSDQINSVNNTGHGLVVITSYAASNTAPTATAQSVTGNEDSPQIITLAGTDAEGDALTYALATNPSNGTVSLNSGIAPINHSTADFVDPSGVNIQLSLSSTGWEGTSGWANAGIYVGPHVSVQPSGYNTPDGDGYFVRNYSGDSKSKYAITKADGNSTIQSADRGNIVFTADWAANTTLGARFVAIVDGTWYASGQFGMAANDHGNMNQTQVTDWEVDLSVNADTDNWYISLAGSPSGYEWRDGNQWSTTPISGGGLPAGNITQFGMAWLHTGNGNYGAVDNFRVINNDGGASAEVTYTPNTNYNGSDSFTFTVSDGVSTSSPATVDISITAVNDAPTISAQSASGNEDEAQEITLAGNDVDGDALTYVLATNSSNGASTLSGNVVTYTPNTNYNGSDSFTFTVSDAEYTSSAATVSITVASVNDLPVILSTPSLDALDGSLYEYSISVNDVDEDVVAITATGPNWLIVDNGTLSGTPSPSDGGLHQIVLSANDGNGGVVTQSYTLAVSLHSLVITGESGYRIFSSPVSGTIYGDLLDELWTQGAEGSDSPNSNPNIWTYGNGWNSVTDFSSDALTAGKGFLMYIFADIDFDGDDDLNDPENPVIISIDGAQQESGVSVVSEPSGWNLIGNPYGLSVDISQMLSDNNGTFNSTIYALDHTNPGYKTHNGVVGNIENDEIKPFDGFWIKADADGNVFEFTEQSILKGSLNNAGRTTTDDSNGSAVFTFTNGDYSSSTYLSFTPEGQINLDPADAYRLVPMSPAEHLTSMIHESGKSLSINNLPLDLSSDISFPMDVMMLSPTEDGYETQAEQVNLSWDVTNLPAGITLELNNNITGQNINLTGYPSANINLPSKGGFSTSGDFMATYPVVGQSQFTLSVYGTLAAVEDDVLPERLTLHSAYPNPFNPSTLIRFDLSNADMVSLDIFDIAGKQVASLISEYMIPGSHQINWNPGNLSSGLYLVNLVVGTETFNQKITFIK